MFFVENHKISSNHKQNILMFEMKDLKRYSQNSCWRMKLLVGINPLIHTQN